MVSRACHRAATVGEVNPLHLAATVLAAAFVSLAVVVWARARCSRGRHRRDRTRPPSFELRSRVAWVPARGRRRHARSRPYPPNPTPVGDAPEVVTNYRQWLARFPRAA